MAADAGWGLGAGVRNGPSGPAGGRRCAQPQDTAASGAGRGRLAPEPRAWPALVFLAAAAVLIKRNDKRERSSSRAFESPLFLQLAAFLALQTQWPLSDPALEATRGSKGTCGLCFAEAAGSGCPRIVGEESLGDAGLPGYWPRNYWL